MNLRERIRLKWVYFTTYIRYIYGKLKDGPYVCEDCGGIMNKEETIDCLLAGIDREDWICNSCAYYEDHYFEDEMDYDPEYSEEEPYIDYEDEYWPYYGD